jgi:hypothetical protein
MIILLIITLFRTDKRLLGFLVFFFFLPVLGAARKIPVKEQNAPAPNITNTLSREADRAFPEKNDFHIFTPDSVLNKQ